MVKTRQFAVHSAMFIAWLALLSACKQDDRTAVATLTDAQGNQVGKATLEASPDGVVLELDIHGLPPGTHGLHIHEHGRCEPPSFESAGGHFNPTHVHHGSHMGDLPNLEVGADGTAEYRATAKDATLDKTGNLSLLANGGTALVIHRDRDDLHTDPAGSSGPRIACGVLESR